MKRLRCTVRDKRGVNGDCMEAAPDGEYVSYSAHLAEVKRLEARIAKLERKERSK